MTLELLRRKCTTRNACIAAIVFAVFALFALCFCSGIPGNDFWWHVKIGEWVLENGTVPLEDIFSWYGTAHGLDWAAHEWLSDVIFHLILSVSDEFGIYLFSIGSALLMMFLLWNEVKQYAAKNLLLSSVYFIAMPFILRTFFYGRPHVFSFFLLFFELKALFRFVENPKSRSIYFIPLISVLWSNLHGGSSNLSYLLCVLFLVAGLLPENIGRMYSVRFAKKSTLKLLLVAVASFLAIMVNPNGFGMVLYPYVNMGDALMLSVISEWSAPDAKEAYQLFLFFAPIFVMTIGFFTGDKRIRVIDALVFLVFLFLFFRSLRFIMLWYIAATFYAFQYLPAFELRFIKNGYKVVVSGLCIVVSLLLIFSSFNTFTQTYANETFIKTVLDDEMIEFVKDEAPERLYNDYNYGEALIYHDIPVFYDARADLYAADHILADGVSLMNLTQRNGSSGSVYVDVDGLVEKYGFDAILIHRGRPLYGYLLKFPEKFELVKEVGDAAYFRVQG